MYKNVAIDLISRIFNFSFSKIDMQTLKQAIESLNKAKEIVEWAVIYANADKAQREDLKSLLGEIVEATNSIYNIGIDKIRWDIEADGSDEATKQRRIKFAMGEIEGVEKIAIPHDLYPKIASKMAEADADTLWHRLSILMSFANQRRGEIDEALRDMANSYKEPQQAVIEAGSEIQAKPKKRAAEQREKGIRAKLMVKDKDAYLVELHARIDGKIGVQVVNILQREIEKEKMLRPTYQEAREEFGEIGNKAGYNRAFARYTPLPTIKKLR